MPKSLINGIKFKSFGEFIGQYIENVIDRTWNYKKQSDMYGVPASERSLLNNNAAVRLSISNYTPFEEEESEDEKDRRRKRFCDKIRKNALKPLKPTNRRLPELMRHPSDRGDSHLAEVKAQEELWN